MFKVVWRIMLAALVALASLAAERGLVVGWRMVTGRKPPESPENPDTSWAAPIAWAMATGAAAGLARLVATRLAAAYYRKSTGRLPEDAQATGAE
ncbi:MAG: DUF4235 domain-containing protein [Kineosporiaceae bacterium]